MMKSTIYDVAKVAGVSIATVSKVINNTGQISEKTRQRVLEVMKSLNYLPSAIASALTGKGTYTIGLLIPDLANPFFAEIARSVEDRGQELGFSVIMCSTDNNPEKEAKYFSLLKQKWVDGIILASGLQNESILTEYIDQNFPVALIAQDILTLTVDTVSVDDFMGGYQATSYLISLGHKKIGLLAENNLHSSKQRVGGYRSALEEKGIPFDEGLLYLSDSSLEASIQQAGRILDRSERPSAIFASNDLLAIGIIQAARQRGILIPNELSLIGFDNTILAKTSDPALTTIAQPIREIGSLGVDFIIEKIKGKKNKKKRILLQPEIIVRNSTKQIVD